MDVTYSMIGADGQQYGPISLGQMQGWIREGRLTPITQVMRSDLNSWLPASQYTELGFAQAPLTMASAPPALSVGNPMAVIARANLERRVKSGASWFFLIGAFSLVNAIVLMTSQSGQHWHFLIGLRVTDIIAYVSSNMGPAGTAIGLGLNLLVLAVFATFGFFARKGHSWSFIAGMVCYALDALLYVLLDLQMGNLLFHGLGLFFMFQGLQANMKLKAMDRGAVA